MNPRFREAVIYACHAVCDFGNKVPKRKIEQRAANKQARLENDKRIQEEWRQRAIDRANAEQTARNAIAMPPPIPVAATAYHDVGNPQVVYIQMAPKKKNPHPLTIVFVILIGLLFIFLVAYTSRNNASKSKLEASPYCAYLAAQTIVRKSMKNPKSAEFDTDSGFYDQRKDGLFEVGGTVRASNSFGAIVPSSWRCVVMYDDDEKGDGFFKLRYLKLGDQENGTYPKDKIE